MLTTKITNIADAIRNKTNTTDKMTLEQMATNIENIKPKLQDKSIEITENSTQTITFDEGYDGLNNVSVTTNVASSGVKYAPQVIRFSNANITSLDYEIANLDTSNMISMSNMFAYSQNIENFDVAHFDTSKVTSMYGIFVNCYAVKTLDLSNWNTSNATDMRDMFNSCKALETIIFGEQWITTRTGTMFKNTSALEKIVIKSTQNLFNLDTGDEFSSSNWITSTTSKVYVPDELVNTYKTMNVWRNYPNKIRPLSEYVG